MRGDIRRSKSQCGCTLKMTESICHQLEYLKLCGSYCCSTQKRMTSYLDMLIRSLLTSSDQSLVWDGKVVVVSEGRPRSSSLLCFSCSLSSCPPTVVRLPERLELGPAPTQQPQSAWCVRTRPSAGHCFHADTRACATPVCRTCSTAPCAGPSS